MSAHRRNMMRHSFRSFFVGFLKGTDFILCDCMHKQQPFTLFNKFKQIVSGI